MRIMPVFLWVAVSCAARRYYAFRYYAFVILWTRRLMERGTDGGRQGRGKEW